MAEVVVDQRRLLKTMRWYDGVVIGLANPGFLLVGLAFSIVYLGGTWALTLWIVSAVIGALQAYIYCEPAAMFPDKPGGLSVYAREGWRKHFSLAGPIAVFGYWFAWSSVLAVYGSFIGLLLIGEFFSADSGIATWTWDPIALSAVDLGQADRHRRDPRLLLLQRSRHAPGRWTQLRRGGDDGHPDRRHRLWRVRHRRRQQPRGRVELRRGLRRVLREIAEWVQRVRARHGLALHPRLVDLRARGRRVVRAGVQGYEERHPQSACGDRRDERRPRVPAPDRRPGDGRLRRDRRRPHRRASTSSTSCTRSPGTRSGRCSRSASAGACSCR